MRSINRWKMVFNLLVGISVIWLAACAPQGYWIPPSGPAMVVVGNTGGASGSGSFWGANNLELTPWPAEATPAALVDESEGPITSTLAPMIESGSSRVETPIPVVPDGLRPSIMYEVQTADTLQSIAVRFGVDVSEITSTEALTDVGYLPPGQLLLIPDKLVETTPAMILIPDSEVVFSPSAAGFDISEFVKSAGGHLSTRIEWLRDSGIISGAEMVLRVALDNSINPRLLLSLIEYHSHTVYGQTASQEAIDHPLGKNDSNYVGLYRQLVWTVNQLSVGYYAYREGRLTEIQFIDGEKMRIAPTLNAGTAALQYYFAQLLTQSAWLVAMDPENGFMAVHTQMYGNPHSRAQYVEPLFPPGLTQPSLILPFQRNWRWSFTGGPHGAWEREGAYAALDFAPGGTEVGCKESDAYVLAAAPGLVVRTGVGLIVIDLDGDGREQTGWVLVYLHVAHAQYVPVGKLVDTGDLLGHPSCEGGISTGTHIHLARKYNGEWIPAGGPLPFGLGGWIAHSGAAAYKGTMTRDGATITACTCANAQSFITRTENDP